MKLSVQSAVSVAEANMQVYKNGIKNDRYCTVEIHGPVVFEMLFGCEYVYARNCSLSEVGKLVRRRLEGRKDLW